MCLIKIRSTSRSGKIIDLRVVGGTTKPQGVRIVLDTRVESRTIRAGFNRKNGSNRRRVPDVFFDKSHTHTHGHHRPNVFPYTRRSVWRRK